MRVEFLESSPEGKDFKMVDENLNRSQQRVLAALEANCTLGCINREVVIRAREGTVLLYSALRRPHLEHDVKLLEKVQRKATRVIRGLEDLSWKDRLREMGEETAWRRTHCSLPVLTESSETRWKSTFNMGRYHKVQMF